MFILCFCRMYTYPLRTFVYSREIRILTNTIMLENDPSFAVHHSFFIHGNPDFNMQGMLFLIFYLHLAYPLFMDFMFRYSL